MSDEHITIPRARLEELEAAEAKLKWLKAVLNEMTAKQWRGLVDFSWLSSEVKNEWRILIHRVMVMLK